ncbi:MAG: GHMP kinase [Planctomycetota bacterium]|nr:MAG: GHMP kinase [Planctomycetota bacterium]
MLLIRKRAYARAGLVGNPSDGYHGKTISLIVRNLRAEVVLYEWDEVELVQTDEDQSRFRSVQELARDVQRHGYYGGIRLVKATIKKFVEFCQRQGHALHPRNFGSSAIIGATLRCLMDFYGIDIPREVQPSLALLVETEELGIAAGLQDRVIQVYEGLVYMDFARERMREQCGYPCGVYEPLDPALLPPVYIAYKTEVSEPTEVFHNDIRARFQRGEARVVEAMLKFAALAAQARDALDARDAQKLALLMNENFNTRSSIYQLPRVQVEMVEQARRVGASAKFAGSGGAIVGTYRDEPMFAALQAELAKINCTVFKPQVAE